MTGRRSDSDDAVVQQKPEESRRGREDHSRGIAVVGARRGEKAREGINYKINTLINDPTQFPLKIDVSVFF